MSEDPRDQMTARERAYQIIFGHQTPAGRGFDVALILAIITSVFVVMLESVETIRVEHGPLLRALEWDHEHRNPRHVKRLAGSPGCAAGPPSPPRGDIRFGLCQLVVLASILDRSSWSR